MQEKRFLLTIAYRGSHYAGWQIQPKNDTIQQRLEAALHELVGLTIRVHGSGRTDTGVHASAQCAHFSVPKDVPMGPENWLAALNTRLPRDIRVMECREVSPDFHARFSATSKNYRYSIWNDPIMPPRQLGWSWHVPRRLDLRSMQRACEQLTGKHDFAHLCARRGNEPSPLPSDYFQRRLIAAQLHKKGPELVLDLQGEGFLYRMVRFITGALVDIGLGKLNQSEWIQLLRGEDVWKHPICAPPDGLSLEKVHY